MYLYILLILINNFWVHSLLRLDDAWKTFLARRSWKGSERAAWWNQSTRLLEYFFAAEVVRNIAHTFAHLVFSHLNNTKNIHLTSQPPTLLPREEIFGCGEYWQAFFEQCCNTNYECQYHKKSLCFYLCMYVLKMLQIMEKTCPSKKLNGSSFFLQFSSREKYYLWNRLRMLDSNKF